MGIAGAQSHCDSRFKIHFYRISGAQSHCDSRFKIHFYRISIKRLSSFNLENSKVRN